MRIDPAALTAMAVARCLTGVGRGRWTAARLAAETGASDAAVANVLTRLTSAQLVQWSPELGSYALARSAAEISVADIVAAAGEAPVHDHTATGTLTAAVWPSLLQALGSVSLREAVPPANMRVADSLGGMRVSPTVH